MRVAYQVDGPGQLLPVDDDFDLVPFQQLADRSPGQGFGGDMSDAGSGGDSAEAGVGEQGYVLAGGQPLERGGDLVNLFHAGACGAAADQHHDVVLADLAVLDGVDGCLFGDEDPGGSQVMKDAVGLDERRIDGRCS